MTEPRTEAGRVMLEGVVEPFLTQRPIETANRREAFRAGILAIEAEAASPAPDRGLREAARTVLWMYDNYRMEAVPEAVGELEDDMSALRAALESETER